MPELLELFLHVNGILFMQLFILSILQLKEHQPQHLPVTLAIRKMTRSFELAEPRNNDLSC